MSPTHGFFRKTRVRAASSHRTTTSPKCKRDSATGPTRASVSAVCVDHSWTQLEHGEACSTAEATRGQYACVHAVLGGLKLADIFTTAGNSAALDVCVATSNAAAFREGAVQAAFSPENLALQTRNSRPACPRHRLSPSGSDSRRSTTPTSHPNPTMRSRHCSVPQRSAKVSQISSAQMEA